MLSMVPSTFFATAPKHLESLLADELRQLGLADVKEARGGASFSGTLADAYRVCLWSRIAHSVLGVLARFPAPNPDALYAGVMTVAWHEHFDTHQTFAITCNSSQSAINHSRFAAQRVKDAIVDQFRERSGSRPSVDPEQPELRINLYLFRDEATLSLDLSGESLHRRGYRTEQGPAPLRETLAAALLLRAGWPETARAGGTFVDPMCGAGTLPIEAALIGADIAPGLMRERWGFTAWRQHDPGTWFSLLEEAERRRGEGLGKIPPIRGFDRDQRMVRIARANVARAGLAEAVSIEQRDLADCRPQSEDQPGLIVTNPPYGTRLGQLEELRPLYNALGQTLASHFMGWRAAVFTGNPELAKSLGLRIARKHTLYNGPIACKLLHFHIDPDAIAAPRRGPRPIEADKRNPGAAMFANRLRKNRKQLSRWREREGISCYRVYDADMPEYAVAIDVYEGEQRWIHVQEYEAPKSVDADKARLRLREALGVIIEEFELNPDNLYFKVRRRQRGSDQYTKLADSRHDHEVPEADCRFLVNFEDYLDTGLFLDHRITRQRIATLAAGRRFLNLFAYTGTATVYAAKGGARSTTTVDMSKTYLDWARRNMALNGFAGPEHEYVQADCMRWLKTASAPPDYGLIFIDPPSFSTSKRMEGTFDVQRDHAVLIDAAARLLAHDGAIVFSNNLRSFRLEDSLLSRYNVKDVSRETIPKDFERNPKIHRCWEIRCL
jgi:23S rRNA (guanine2445-N2)-methyltransferase / 23S rRNA (guanine2069-N7)-methyltransferase